MSEFKLPIVDCLITSHKCPDGDAISSCKAIYDHITKKGKMAAIKLKGNIPKNLKWILEDATLVNEFPVWAKQLIILDSDRSESRLGWKVPNVPIINIDHHTYRLNEHDPLSNNYVIDSCSTASILLNYFGIRNDILVIGVYTDTYFIKRMKEVFAFVSKLKISEEKIEEYLNKINFKSDRKIWRIIRDSKIHKCKNGIVIIETDESDPAAIEGAMHILCELNDTICLIYGDKFVKLRTSNINIDVSEIAKKFNGNGHKYASGFQLVNNTGEFKEFIIHLEIKGERNGKF